MRVRQRSKVMLNRIAIRLLLVDGPAPLAMSIDDRKRAIAFTLDATRLLRRLASAWAGVRQPAIQHEMCRFLVDTTVRTISPPPPPAKTGNRVADISAQELSWLPTLIADMGLTAASQSLYDLREALADEADVRLSHSYFGRVPTDTCTVVVTTFPTGWMAYADPDHAVAIVQWQDTRAAWKSVDRVIAHEVGHLFGGLDEYVDPSQPFTCNPAQTGGPFGEANPNCEVQPNAVPCLMRRNSETICGSTALHWGWRDADTDGVADPLTAPQLDTVDPVYTPPGKSVVLNGPGMRFATRVSFGGVPAPGAFINPGKDEVAADMPAGPDGILSIQVQTVAGSAAPAVGDKFVIRGTANIPARHFPAVFGLIPNHGRAGDRIRLIGANLLSTTAVHFGFVDGTPFDAGDSDIEVTVPAGFGLVGVTVTTGIATSVAWALSMFSYD